MDDEDKEIALYHKQRLLGQKLTRLQVSWTTGKVGKRCRYPRRWRRYSVVVVTLGMKV
jgi:hypothetical protein